MPVNKRFKRYGLVLSVLFSFLVNGLVTGRDTVRDGDIKYFISNRIPVENQNWKVFQSPKTGYVYFANSVGLIEYNGISSRIYTMPYRQGLRSVYVNAEGVVFTGSFEDFGFWKEDGKGGLVYQSLASSTDVGKNDEIWNIYELNNVIYFQSFTAIYRFDTTGVTKIPGPSILLFFFKTGDRFLVQSIGQGLFWFDGSGFDLIEGSEQISTMKIHAVITRKFDEYWICTANNGIYIFNGRSFTPQKSEISKFLTTETCNAGVAINDTLFAFGTILKGVIFCDEKGEILKSYDCSNGLNNNTVLSLHKCGEKGLWVGLDEGANYINIASPNTLYANFTGNLGTIYSAIREKDRLYLGTNHGLFMANIRASKGDYDFTDLEIIPNSQGQVWQLARFDGQILCGHNDGTFLVENGVLYPVSDVTGGWSMKEYSDFLLEGTYTGIVSFKRDARGRWTYRNRIRGYLEPTRSIETDYLGYVWATHPHKGLYRLELNEEIDSVVNALYFSSIADTSARLSMSKINNQVVFMTSEYIYSYDYEGNRFYPVRSLEEGLGEYIKATQIIPYQKNSYWFILGNRIGLFEISKELKARKIFEFFHNYADLPGREQQIIQLDNNTLLIPTRQAFTTFNLERLSAGNEPQAVRFSRLVFNGRSSSTIIIPGNAAIRPVPNRENNLTVWFANPSHFDVGDKEYMYRIAELGDGWHKTNLDNFSFLNLGFGHYHLQVKTTTDEKITETLFTIRRPNYLSIPAIIGYVILLAVLIVVIINIFKRQLERHRKLIEYEVGKNKLESELDYKSYELMLTMRYLIRKTDILRELHEKLDALKTYSSKFPVKYIREMERIIDHGLDSQTEEWQNVMKNLKLSQEGFFRKLKEKYPSLTPNDLRLCSYLRMNFSTKEIANLINISSRAVEIGRYRLRRKMNLGHDVNLNEFLIREAEIS